MRNVNTAIPKFVADRGQKGGVLSTSLGGGWGGGGVETSPPYLAFYRRREL